MKEGSVQRKEQATEWLFQVQDLKKTYSRGSSSKKNEPVLKGVSFSIAPGEIIGLIGASGAGKSTIGRIIAGLEKADSGQIMFQGQDLLQMKAKERREVAQWIQMVFQDPYESLSSRMTIEQIVMEPLMIQKIGQGDVTLRKKMVREALAEVSLVLESYMSRYPHELSGGERQRVGLARAFVCQPSLIIADEPTSMLDTSLRFDLLQLMKEMGKRHQISYLFVTHDIALTRGFCDRLIVLDQGEIVEEGKTENVIDYPQHPFTQSLIQAVLQLEQY
ncbi:ABC transporter ATP-binding protein [Peribacillus asahii]|uniref:ABC transporter ATP-binding protein n=1 Tax=Peribacillus asahii TaxID=228899 RepID=UPI00207A8744|nr:ABC transporter ATP-binding protein [Peribacillus asahii]USK70261.1 ATP-binding cassette domain-containing protein [Peribacillus asahii]